MSKYHSIKVSVNGLIFDSQKEYAYWVYLIAEQNKKKIWKLQRQVPYLLTEPKRDSNGKMHRARKYYADFVYEDTNGKHVVDAKGCRTDVYTLKRDLMLDRYGITIEEV